MIENESRPCGDSVEYKLDLVIAQRVKELKLGLNGCRRHSGRALAIQVTGMECQHTGKELSRLSQWTLQEE